MIVDFKINGVITAKEYNGLSFGCQLEYRRKIGEFMEAAKHGWVSQKRTPRKKAVRDFLKLHDAKEFYYRCEDSKECRDDSFEIWYR